MLTLPCRPCSACVCHIGLSDEAVYCWWLGLSFDGSAAVRRCHGFRYVGIVPASPEDLPESLPVSEAGKTRLVSRVLAVRDAARVEGSGTAALVTSGVKSHFETNRPKSGGGR